jgi:uncharacterized protein (TIGR02271 family)
MFQRKAGRIMSELIKLSQTDIDRDASLDGYDAYDSSGEKLGSIDDVIARADSMKPLYLVVNTGGLFGLFGNKFVVPVGDVARTDETEQRVYFRAMSKQTLESGSYPKYDDSWWDQNDHSNWSRHEQDVARSYESTRQPGTPVDYFHSLYQRPQEGTQRLQLMEERLRINKEREQAGSVRLGKRITEHTETVNVPVREERVVIERTPGSGEVAVGDRQLREGETVEVPVTRERVEVTKQPVVAEQVNVRKETTERTEQARETVRKEELDVRDSSGTVRGDGQGNGHTRSEAERAEPTRRT